MNKLFHWVPMALFALMTFGFSTTSMGGIPLLPGLAVAWIFHWTTYIPRQLLALPLVGVGAVLDLILDNPMGLTPLLFLVSHLVLIYLRHHFYALSFIYIWGIFGVYCLLYALLDWAFSCLLTLHWITPTPHLYSLLVAFVIYPFLSRGMIFIQRQYHE